MILPMPNVVFHGLFTATAVLITCLSLAKLGAPANLQGLYVWARDTARVRFR